MLLRRRDRLFERFRRTGDARALAGVFDLTAPELLRVATHLVGDRATAEDLVQSTFLQVIQDARRFEPGRPVLPWLLGILANFARRHRRAQRRQPEGEPVERLCEVSPVDEAERAELRESVARALAALPETFRQILVLHLEHGLTAKEIAEVLGQPPGTVRTYVVRGMERLRRLLPGGLATGVAVVAGQERGLAAVRAEVLAAAGAGAGVGAGVGVVAAWSVLGVLMAKQKVWVAAAVILCGVAGGTWWVAERGAEEPSEGTSQLLAGPVVASRVSAKSLDAPPGSRVALDARSHPEVPGSLLVRVRHASDGAPAASQHMEIRRDWGSPRALVPLVGELVTDAQGLARIDQVLGNLCVVTDVGARGAVHVRSGAAAELTIEIQAGLTVEGEVVDHEQQPLPGARVVCSPDQHWSGDVCTLATADATGRFRVRDLQQDRHSLWAEAAGLRPSAVESPTFRAGGTARVRLVLGAPGHRLEGQVADERGGGVPHALVGIAMPEPSYESQGLKGYQHRAYDTRVVRAGADGCFAVDWVPPGELTVLARHPDLDTRLRGMARAAVAGDLRNRIVVVVRELPAVSGTVRDASGRPIVDVIVAAFLGGGVSFGPWGSLFTDDGATRTAADGTYRIRGLLPLQYELGVGGASLRVTQTVELVVGQDLQWDPVLSAGVPLRVRIVDPEGEACAGWDVLVYKRSGAPVQPLWQMASETTDAEGRAAMPPLKDGSYLIRAHAPLTPTPAGWPRTDPFPALAREDVHPSASEVTLTLPREQRPSVRLRGRIVDVDGRPVRAASVSWRRLEWKEGYNQFSFPADLNTGEFDLGPVVPATYELSFSADGWIGGRTAGRTARLDEVLDFGDLRLTQPAFVTVRWATADGKPPKGAVVLLGKGDWMPTPYWNDPSADPGTWCSKPLESGTWRLFATADGMAPVRREFTLVPGARECLELALEAGVPVPLELVFGWIDGGICSGTLLVRDSAGAAVLEEGLWGYFNDLKAGMLRRDLSLRPGRYQVRATGPNRAGEIEVLVPATGLASPLVLRLR